MTWHHLAQSLEQSSHSVYVTFSFFLLFARTAGRQTASGFVNTFSLYRLMGERIDNTSFHFKNENMRGAWVWHRLRLWSHSPCIRAPHRAGLSAVSGVRLGSSVAFSVCPILSLARVYMCALCQKINFKKKNKRMRTLEHGKEFSWDHSYNWLRRVKLFLSGILRLKMVVTYFS